MPEDQNHSMRSRLKLGFANSLLYTGLLALAGRLGRGQNDLILTLHRVLPPLACGGCYDEHMVLSTTAFEDLLLYLKQHTEIVSLNALVTAPSTTPHVQRIALTFDDGWRDTFQHALPLLVKYEAPATVFICSSLIGSSAMLPEERLTRIFDHCAAKGCTPSFLHHLSAWGGVGGLSASADWRSFTKKIPMSAKLSLTTHLEVVYGLKRPTGEHLMSWQEVQTMAASGIEIGSHTANHVTLSVESRAVTQRELNDSRDVIADRLGAPPRYLSYPNGSYNQSVVLLAMEAGYSHAFTTQHGSVTASAKPFTLPRVPMDNTVVTDGTGRLHPARTALHLSPLRTRIEKLRSQHQDA